MKITELEHYEQYKYLGINEANGINNPMYKYKEKEKDSMSG